MIVTLKLQDNIVYEINLQNKIKGELNRLTASGYHYSKTDGRKIIK